MQSCSYSCSMTDTLLIEDDNCLNDSEPTTPILLNNSTPNSLKNDARIAEILDLGLKKKGLNFGHLNVQGLNNLNKFEELKIMLTSSKNNIDIIGFSETKFRSDVDTNAYCVKGFLPPFRKDQSDRNGGGGLLVYVRNGLNVRRRVDLETQNIESIVLEVFCKSSNPFFVCHIYRHPCSKSEWKDRFELFLEKIENEDKEIILLGDVNRNLLDSHLNDDWSTFLLTLGLSQVVTVPTRKSKNACTLIDHIYTTNDENITSTHVPQISISDHFPVFCNRKVNSQSTSGIHKTITYRSFKNFDNEAFCDELKLVDWSVIQSCDNTDDMLDKWRDLFLTVVDKYAPTKTQRVKKQLQPEWLTPDILDTMRERDKCKFDKNDQHGEKYRSLRNKVLNLIFCAKKETYQRKIENGKSDPRTIWKLFRELRSSNNESGRTIHSVNIDGNDYNDSCEIANIFNDFFVNIAAKLKDQITESNFDYIEQFVNSKVPHDITFDIPEISVDSVLKGLNDLDSSKATGIDNIGPRLLKLSANIIAGEIAYIINSSIASSTFPEVWKFAKVKPLFKAGKCDDVNNYRPISILPSLSKILERHVQKYFIRFLEMFDLLYHRQSGFRTGHSTETSILCMVDRWLQALNDGQLIGVIMVDFRKAFDMVDHAVLLKKLAIYKCSDATLQWFKSYLCERKQIVTINNACSNDKTISCGVPQGSILGPLLFIIFINDLSLLVSNEITASDLYADDTTLYDIQSQQDVLERNLQVSLNELHTWCLINGMKINRDKTKVLLITSSQKKSTMVNSNLELKYENIVLKTSCSEKLLGVYIADTLKWDVHVKYVVKKLSTNIWLLNKIRYFINTDYRVLFYKAYIQPHLDYCCIIWGNTTRHNIELLMRLQRRACKIMLGQDYVSLKDSMVKINAMTFDQRVLFQKAIAMYKIFNKAFPSYITDNFQLRGMDLPSSHMSLRSESNHHFYIPQPRSEFLKKSLQYSGPKLWNAMPLEIKQSRSLNMFKIKCKTWLNSKYCT